MVLFIEWPWLALLPAGVFALVWTWRRSPFILVAAAFWLLYFAWEIGMKLRILCSGECNIRVDLLLIYPFLLVLSAVAIVQAMRRPRADATR